MKCTFCNKELEQGTGLMLIKNDGKILGYCSKKCLNNSKIRNPRKVKWLTKKTTKTKVKTKTKQEEPKKAKVKK